MPRIFAITARGLEDVSLSELTELSGIREAAIAYRRLTATYEGDLESLLTLRTIDDIFLEAARWEQVTHTRQALSDFRIWSAELELRPLVRTLRELRSFNPHPIFSVTANFVGKRNYTMPEIKAAVSEGVLSHYKHWRYTEEDAAAELNLRVFIEHDQAVIGVRIGAQPLYRRPYKQAHLPGSLKPSVAAAMLRLINAKPGQTLLDAFCGSGTILVEGALQGLVCIGGDHEPEAVEYARQNLLDARVNAVLYQGDAARLPLRPQSVDLAVSNLPWGRQIQIDRTLASLYAASLDELRQRVKPGGSVVLLTNAPQLLDHSNIVEQREISLFGQNPTIVVYRG